MRVEKHRAAHMRLESPIMLVCLDGWVDAGGVLERTSRALLDGPAVLLAEFDADLAGHAPTPPSTSMMRSTT